MIVAVNECNDQETKLNLFAACDRLLGLVNRKLNLKLSATFGARVAPDFASMFFYNNLMADG